MAARRRSRATCNKRNIIAWGLFRDALHISRSEPTCKTLSAVAAPLRAQIQWRSSVRKMLVAAALITTAAAAMPAALSAAPEAAAQQAQAAPESEQWGGRPEHWMHGQGGPGMGERHGMQHRMMHRDPQERCEDRLAWRAAMRAYTEAKLNLTAEQRPLWDKVQSAAQGEEQKERQLCANLKPRAEFDPARPARPQAAIPVDPPRGTASGQTIGSGALSGADAGAARDPRPPVPPLV